MYCLKPCSNVFLAMIIVILSVPFIKSFVIAADEETYPLSLPPQMLAAQLEEPIRSMRLIMAESLAETQKSLLSEAVINSTSPVDAVVIGFALAAEEYYLMELSYPDSLDSLVESGYWLPDWHSLGISLVDFDDYHSEACELQVLYVPQPIGLVELTCIPGRPCVYRMRSYSEYSLAVLTECADYLYNKPPEINTPWFTPFSELGFSEILHVNQNFLVKTQCASCSVD